jgi:tricorn protease
MHERQGYYRSPTVYDERVVFVSEDDLWEVELTGGIARRMTSGLGQARHPTFSPDGQMLAYTGSEEGATEIYVMAARGGPARQLTFHGASCETVGWTHDGQIVFRSNHHSPFRRIPALWSVSPEGGQAKQLHYGPALHLALQNDGPGIALARHTDDLAWWKRYRGGLAGAIWVDSEGDGKWERLNPEMKAGSCRPIWIGDWLYFTSDLDGYANLYRCRVDGSEREQVTHHQGFYVRFASADSSTLVYTHGGDIYRIDLGTGEGHKIPIDFVSPRTQLNRKFVDADLYLDERPINMGALSSKVDLSIHPEGHSMMLTSRGKPFHFGFWEGPVQQLGKEQGVRYRLARYLGDGKRVVLISDEGGEEQLEVHHLSDPTRIDVVTTDKDIGRAIDCRVSPTGDLVAVTNHRLELITVDLLSGETKCLDRSREQRIDGLDWSPCGAWIAYALQDENTSVIRIVRHDSGQIHTITSGEFRDFGPRFDPKGRYLYFLSYRFFEPVYDELFFDIGFPSTMKPCVVTLRNDVDSPFFQPPRPLEEPSETPEAQGDSLDNEKAVEDTETEESAEPTAPSDDAVNAKSVETIEIDFEQIERRVQCFPVQTGSYGEIQATEDKVFFTLFPRWKSAEEEPEESAGGILYSYCLREYKAKSFAHGVDQFDIGVDQKTMIYGRESLRVVAANQDGATEEGHTASRKTGWIDTTRLAVGVEPTREWSQMLREAWRLMRDHFWDEKMSGVDWNEAWERYKTLLGRISTRSEFSDLTWTMQGELGTSHAYEYGGDYRPSPQYRTGSLGADVSWDSAAGDLGALRIDQIIWGDVWSNEAASPLARPGLTIQAGDHILSVNGRRVSRTTSIEELLVQQAGKEIELLIRNPEGKESMHSVRTVHSDRAARYRTWIERNRELVRERTNGEVGYVHVPDMGPEGFAEFHRGFLSQCSRRGLIVDVRNNGGGHVSQLLLEKLARTRLGYDIPRWGQPVPYPSESILGPIVALTNEYSGSDGDIFSHCFKLMNLGTLVGKRTWGGVVGIWPRHSLVDKSSTTQPEFSFWFQDVGFGVENHGTEPDVEVEISPAMYAAQRDVQLERAVEVILKDLGETNPGLPDFGPMPNLAPPEKG